MLKAGGRLLHGHGKVVLGLAAAAEGVVNLDVLQVKLSLGVQDRVITGILCGALNVVGPTASGCQKRLGNLGADELAQGWLEERRGRRRLSLYKLSHEEPFHGKPNVNFEPKQ
jgi:hypothetical protein